MNVLVLGGAGFLGSNLVRRCLVEKDVRVTVVDSLETLLHGTTKNLRAVWDRIHFVRSDIRDEFRLAELVQGQHVVFNCAAQTSHPLSIRYPLFDADVNCVGNLKLLEAVRLLNPQAVVVYPSSSTAIGKAIHEVVDEDHPERPLEIYSANKGVAEKYYRIYHNLHGLKTVILRFANLFGPYGKGFPEFGFINYFISRAWSGEAIEIFGSGAQTRNVTYVGDAVEIMWRAAQEVRLHGRMHFATSDLHLSVKTIAETIVKVLGRGSVKFIEWPAERKAIEVEKVVISSARLRAITGWSARYDLEAGLVETRAALEAEEKHPA